MNLSTPIKQIPRIGPVYIKRLHKMGIQNVHDLLFHFPHRYEDFSKITPISRLKLNKTSCIKGKILEIKTTRTWKRRIYLTEALVEDGTAAIKVVWFNQPYLTKTLKKGEEVYLVGKVMIGKGGAFLSNPSYEKTDKKDLVHTARLVPIYPETAGLSSRWLRYILRPLLERFENKIPEILPQELIKQQGLLPINEAVWQVHFPDSIKIAKEAQKRFAFQELFLIELFVLREKLRMAKEKAVPIPFNLELIQRFTKSLPFKLTDAQKKAAWRILKNLERPYPMNRLLQGDVGSGKTVVAVMAALNTIRAGWQVTFMAPTEILANQHFQSVARLLRGFRVDVGLLTGKSDRWISKKLNDPIEISRQKLLQRTKEGKIDILIGTHALIQDKVKFKKLGLVVLDEQHRFGVKQRAKLLSKTNNTTKKEIPHLLSMTATPIPRTLALTIYGDLDLSLIDELPRGRKQVVTKIVRPEEREATYEFIRQEIKKGRQTFIICPRIEDSGTQDLNLIAAFQGNSNRTRALTAWQGVKTVKEEYERLSQKVFPELKVVMLHGKMPGKEKERVMNNFKNKKIDILVSTSVVEVGVDIPNATIMMIEGAERFGLAQLHQFRGRVGRATYQSYCFLLTTQPYQKSSRRLRALIKTTNGFKLAEDDLKIRGPGDFSGVRQWGIPDLAMASLANLSLVETTRNAALELLHQDLKLKNYPYLKVAIKRFGKKVHLE